MFTSTFVHHPGALQQFSLARMSKKSLMAHKVLRDLAAGEKSSKKGSCMVKDLIMAK